MVESQVGQVCLRFDLSFDMQELFDVCVASSYFPGLASASDLTKCNHSHLDYECSKDDFHSASPTRRRSKFLALASKPRVDEHLSTTPAQ